MKTYDEILQGAKRLYHRSFKLIGVNDHYSEKLQDRADFLLHWVLGMTTDEADHVWEEAQQEYNEAHKTA